MLCNTYAARSFLLHAPTLKSMSDRSTSQSAYWGKKDSCRESRGTLVILCALPPSDSYTWKLTLNSGEAMIDMGPGRVCQLVETLSGAISSTL